MKYQHLLFDLDHTLWDFASNCRVTLAEIYEEMALEQKGIHSFDLFYSNYQVHNEKLWERYRNGFIKQEELRVKRMRLALLDFKIADEKLAIAMGERFLELLPTRTILFPHTIELLAYLSDKGYQLHLVTNGFEKTQHSKLKYSGLSEYFEEVITSESSNSLKPNKEIFEFAFQKIGTDPSATIMIGDTLAVDILGAMNAGIDQIYVNHISKEKESINGQFPTHTVYSLKEIEGIL